jgi:hypothetical protein
MARAWSTVPMNQYSDSRGACSLVTSPICSVSHTRSLSNQGAYYSLLKDRSNTEVLDKHSSPLLCRTRMVRYIGYGKCRMVESEITRSNALGSFLTGQIEY